MRIRVLDILEMLGGGMSQSEILADYPELEADDIAAALAYAARAVSHPVLVTAEWFLVDQQLPRRLADWIAVQGHEAHHVRAMGMAGAEDIDIWREASRRGAVIVSKDEDFSIIVRRQTGPTVIWVRLGNCGNDRLLARFDEAWSAVLNAIADGAPLIELR